MLTDPTLLFFVLGVLVGAATVFLGRTVPDVIFVIRHLIARRRVRDTTRGGYFPG
jgi:hypothetical protein